MTSQLSYTPLDNLFDRLNHTLLKRDYILEALFFYDIFDTFSAVFMLYILYFIQM